MITNEKPQAPETRARETERERENKGPDIEKYLFLYFLKISIKIDLLQGIEDRDRNNKKNSKKQKNIYFCIFLNDSSRNFKKYF